MAVLSIYTKNSDLRDSKKKAELVRYFEIFLKVIFEKEDIKFITASDECQRK